MMKSRFLGYAVLLLFAINIVNAATIHGTVYDLSLKKVDNARVEINTSPKQLMVAQNGTYSFSVPNGAYAIKAQLMQRNTIIASVQENITIKQDGSYVVDMILFPDIGEGVEDPEIDVNGSVVEENNNSILLVWLIALFASGITIGVVYFLKTRKKKAIAPEETSSDYDLGKVIDIIKKEGGRATQKEIRKQIPLSEAKISLMIAELEHKGVVEKIKKGRGNIIILKKK